VVVGIVDVVGFGRFSRRHDRQAETLRPPCEGNEESRLVALHRHVPKTSRARASPKFRSYQNFGFLGDHHGAVAARQSRLGDGDRAFRVASGFDYDLQREIGE
jgi:hypothetical protein